MYLIWSYGRGHPPEQSGTYHHSYFHDLVFVRVVVHRTWRWHKFMFPFVYHQGTAVLVFSFLHFSDQAVFTHAHAATLGSAEGNRYITHKWDYCADADM